MKRTPDKEQAPRRLLYSRSRRYNCESGLARRRRRAMSGSAREEHGSDITRGHGSETQERTHRTPSGHDLFGMCPQHTRDMQRPRWLVTPTQAGSLWALRSRQGTTSPPGNERTARRLSSLRVIGSCECHLGRATQQRHPHRNSWPRCRSCSWSAQPRLDTSPPRSRCTSARRHVTKSYRVRNAHGRSSQ
jgi:hypothetical protein